MALPAPSEFDIPVVAVRTTGIFCLTSCPATPLPKNVEHLRSAGAAMFSGYRPCLRCRPLETAGRGLSTATLKRAADLRSTLDAARRARRRRSGAEAIVITLVPTPLGPMLIGATDDGVCLAEFTDRPMLPTQLATLQRRLKRRLVAGSHRHLEQLRGELAAYFEGSRITFSVRLVAPGTPFQEHTWAELQRIDPGKTVSYEDLADKVGRPHAQRAVGTANGANRIAVVIPCHRVVRKGGETGNYGGGRWRKEWLLAHERSHPAPAVEIG